MIGTTLLGVMTSRYPEQTLDLELERVPTGKEKSFSRHVVLSQPDAGDDTAPIFPPNTSDFSTIEHIRRPFKND